MSLYLLSIHSEYVDLILGGRKKWEFRKNPNFGQDLKPMDIIFIVAPQRQQDKPPQITCRGVVEKILRGQEVYEYFRDRESKRWEEAGCSENSHRDWNYFEENIIHSYPTAIKIKPTPVDPPVNTAIILHKTKNSPWKGIGFTPAENLHRYSIEGLAVEQYLRRLLRSI